MRDRRGRSEPPKPVSVALAGLRREIAPKTVLADAQAAWPAAVGERIAAVTKVDDEREGTLYVDCQNSVWSQELTLMEARLRTILGEAMDAEPPRHIRFRAVS